MDVAAEFVRLLDCIHSLWRGMCDGGLQVCWRVCLAYFVGVAFTYKSWSVASVLRVQGRFGVAEFVHLHVCVRSFWCGVCIGDLQISRRFCTAYCVGVAVIFMSELVAYVFFGKGTRKNAVDETGFPIPLRRQTFEMVAKVCSVLNDFCFVRIINFYWRQ